MSYHVAIDLGAGSGRAFLGSTAGDRLALEEVHRFHYTARPSAGCLRWDWGRLVGGLQMGLRSALDRTVSRGTSLASIGVDTWGVDYGLLDSGGNLLEEPVCYRDHRTDEAMTRAFARVPREEIVARTGVCCQQFNTLYQLFAHTAAGLPPRTARLLLMPDLCHHHLCGSDTAEFTIATTTQMLNARTGTWDRGFIDRLGLPFDIMPPIRPAGTRLGTVSRAAAGDPRLEGLPVVAPASHDTASAVVGTPLRPSWAYISSGTWSLEGVELDRPILTPEAVRAGFTNEGGPFGTVRFLKNVMGLWLLESCRREWQDQPIAGLLGRVAAVEGFAGFVYPDNRRFFNPESMTHEIRAALAETGQAVPDDPVLLAKVILDSLALRYAVVIEEIERLTGRSIGGLHIVGGGSQNDYLNQAAASAAGRTVVAGPTEATAAGNVLVQAIALGRIESVAQGRALLERSLSPRTYEPRDAGPWARALERYREIEALSRA